MTHDSPDYPEGYLDSIVGRLSADMQDGGTMARYWVAKELEYALRELHLRGGVGNKGCNRPISSRSSTHATIRSL